MELGQETDRATPFTRGSADPKVVARMRRALCSFVLCINIEISFASLFALTRGKRSCVYKPLHEICQHFF